MSINSLSCIQSIIANKTLPPSGPPPIIQTMSNVYTQNPFLYWTGDSGQITTNSKGAVMAFRTTISNQISPYTFKNGYYYVTTSDTISGTNALGGDLYTTFCGNINNVPDTPWQSPTVYSTSGAYTGTTQTVTSGTTVYGEWVQIRLPYKLYITNYQVNSNANNNGAYWNNLFTTSFYLCASNDGTTWTTIENRTGVTCATNGLNNFTVTASITTGYYYFRFIGCSIGAQSGGIGTRMCVNLALGGTYRG